MKLKKLFVCPKCKDKLGNTNSYYECTNCQIQYPIIEDIPVFITGQVDSDQMNEFWDKGWQNRLGETDHKFLVEYNSEQLKSSINDAK